MIDFGSREPSWGNGRLKTGVRGAEIGGHRHFARDYPVGRFINLLTEYTTLQSKAWEVYPIHLVGLIILICETDIHFARSGILDPRFVPCPQFLCGTQKLDLPLLW